jgi:Predicted ATPase with chaperone activity
LEILKIKLYALRLYISGHFILINVLIYKHITIILPHHNMLDVALVGGGTFPQPGEISSGHNGVLFLDELPEFKRTVLEVMRQPLEDRVITISRAKSTNDYPASLMVVYLNVYYI